MKKIFEELTGQKYEYSDPQDGTYYAFVSMINLDENNEIIDIMFELVEQIELITSISENGINNPFITFWKFHTSRPTAPNIEEFDIYGTELILEKLENNTILEIFDENIVDDIKEGNVYKVKLKLGKALNGQSISGTLFNPDIMKEYPYANKIHLGSISTDGFVKSEIKFNNPLIGPDPTKESFQSIPLHQYKVEDEDEDEDEANSLRRIRRRTIGDSEIINTNKPELMSYTLDNERSKDSNSESDLDNKSTIAPDSDSESDGEEPLSNMRLKNTRTNKFDFKIKNEKKINVTQPINNLQQTPTYLLGVMDVGTGNCNMIIDSNFNLIAYYDMGIASVFNAKTIPKNLRKYNSSFPANGGPTLNYTPQPLKIIISHWDYDHFGLADIADMTTYDYIYYYMNAPHTIAGNIFFKRIRNKTKIITPLFTAPNIQLYQITGNNINNNGLVLRLKSSANHYLLSTGDASFDQINGNVKVNIEGIVAAHHGSCTHGAANNLPIPITIDPAHNNNPKGCIAYSYGITDNGNRPYNFPKDTAVNSYRDNGWTIEAATAEEHIPPYVQNNQMNIIRGNILMGNNPNNVDQINGGGVTAFSTFQKFLQPLQ